MSDNIKDAMNFDRGYKQGYLEGSRVYREELVRQKSLEIPTLYFCNKCGLEINLNLLKKDKKEEYKVVKNVSAPKGSIVYEHPKTKR